MLAVAVLAMIRSKTNAFPLSTVVIEQYRPPIDKFIIGELHTCSPSDMITIGSPQSSQQVQLSVIYFFASHRSISIKVLLTKAKPLNKPL
jgi:hypothetical protein